MKIGDFVLIQGGYGTWIVRKITGKEKDGYLISDGYTQTFYKSKDMHKCPGSISRKYKILEEKS